MLAPHYELWVPLRGLAKLWQACGRRRHPGGNGSARGFSHRRRHSGVRHDIAERDLAQETSQMRALTSIKAATWARRSWSASAREERTPAPAAAGVGPVPAAGTEPLRAGIRRGSRAYHECGRVVLLAGSRVCDGDDSRSPKRAISPDISAAAGEGTARILDAAPKL